MGGPPTFSGRGAPSRVSENADGTQAPPSPVAVAARGDANAAVARADDLVARFLAGSKQEAPLPVADAVVEEGAIAAAASESLAASGLPRFGSRELSGARLGAVAPVPKAPPASESALSPPIPVYAAAVGPFSKHGDLSAPAVRALRADIKSASIVTDLVAAMAMRPGSDADVGLKSKVLTSLLICARHAADDLIQMVDPARSDVGWVRAQALSQTASMLAKEWRSGDVDESEARRRMDLRLEVVRALLSDSGGEVECSLAIFAEGDRYKECTNQQSAADHRAVAIHQVAWVLSEAVGAVRSQDGSVFAFGLKQEEIISALLQQSVVIVNASKPDIQSPDAAITYLRGAMRRISSLIAAEYRSKAAEICAWVDASEGQAQRNQRIEDSAKMFADSVVPFIAHWGLKNFRSIERASRRLIEESQDEQKSTDRPGH